MARLSDHVQTKSIPIPADCYVNQKDQCIYVKVPTSEQHSTRVVVGRLASLEDNTFYPNGTFGEMYPDLWRQNFGTDPMRPPEVRIGIHAVVAHILKETGLCEVLCQVLDQNTACAMLDCAVYAMLSAENLVASFDDYAQEDQFFFGEGPYPDGWIEDFLSEQIPRDAAQRFQSAWRKRCLSGGLTECWVCIGGDNKVLSQIFSPEKQAQSYVAAVCADGPCQGMPLAYRIYNNGLMDWRQLQETLDMLKEAGIHVKGILLDFQAVSFDDIRKLQSSGIDFIAMLHRSLEGWDYMEKHCAEQIHGHFQSLLSQGGDLFAAEARHSILSDGEDEATLCMYFNSTEHRKQGNQFRALVMDGAQELEAKLRACQDGQLKNPLPTVPNALQRYLSITEPGEDGCRRVAWNYDAIDRHAWWSGYWALASSLTVSAREMLDLYHLRDSVETQFSMHKIQAAGQTEQDAVIENWDGWYLATFLAAILRAHFLLGCHEHDSEPDKIKTIVDNLNGAVVCLGEPGSYYYNAQSIALEQKSLFAQFGVTKEELDDLAEKVTRQYRNAVAHVFQNPQVLERQSRGRSPKPDSAEPKAPKRGRGRPKGSKNKPKTPEK